MNYAQKCRNEFFSHNLRNEDKWMSEIRFLTDEGLIAYHNRLVKKDVLGKSNKVIFNNLDKLNIIGELLQARGYVRQWTEKPGSVWVKRTPAEHPTISYKRKRVLYYPGEY